MAEPELGWFRLRSKAPLFVECVPRGNLRRSVETALRLCALLSIWSRGGLLLHATGLARGRFGALCLALSGGGKSTLTDLADGFESLSDETLALLPTPSGKVELLGTTFRSSAVKVPVLRSAALRALLLLEKSPVPRHEPAPRRETVRKIFQQSYTARPEAGGVAELMERAATVARSVPAYRFAFPKGPEAGRLLDALAAQVSGASSPGATALT